MQIDSVLVPNPFNIIQNVWRSNRVLKSLVKREIQKTYQGSMLGAFWLVIAPLIRLSIYTFVFGVIFGGRFADSDGGGTFDYALGVFLGLIIFQVIVDGITVGPNVILKNANLVKKVLFPTEILPVAAASVSFLNLFVGIILVTIAVVVLNIGFSLSQLWFPVIVIPVLLLSVGLYWLFGALGVYIRDVAQATQVLSMLLLFGSAIFYPLSMVPEEFQSILKLNPIVHAIELSRITVLWHEPIELLSLGYLYVVGVGVFCIGYYIFSRLRSGFADVM